MPSVAIAEAQSADKKITKNSGVAGMEVEENNSAEKKLKKEKKSSKKAKLTDLDDSNSDSPVKISKKEKKRKALEIDDNEEGRSENTSEMKKKKKMKFMEDDEKEENPNAVSNFRISAPLREALKAKGIEALFHIQAMTFDTILGGSDLVGRARTGQGKTLAFVLPILESLTNGPAKESRKTGYGKAPSVLVLLPTRELAAHVLNQLGVQLYSWLYTMFFFVLV
ncbi:DEAD-box ATP-dependent RNA helicase 7-like isoform X2 [Salvia splendens]|uniref:DEAD-box ATP-dependent RNA helicase 7-like isoform X2 n=1 Tax=Salvia splendens TaxID=180675 RepID=UPI001C257DEE|nr:DEAD-box ATP-dependent RNA helicase 7-like isoform X2 [Salvia splendens]